MRSEHPTPGELLDHHFEETRGRAREQIAAHVAECSRCREELASVEWVDTALAVPPDEDPPADGLERVLDRVATEHPPRVRRAGWLAPVAATVAGVGAGVGTIYAAGAWLSTPAGGLSGFGLAALAFFGIGSFVTLALAPVLLIEAQSRRRALAGR